MLKKKNQQIFLDQKEDLRYSVTFQTGIFTQKTKAAQALGNLVKGRKLVIIVDENVFSLYGQDIESFFKKNKSEYLLYKIKATEKNKSIDSVLKICAAAKKFGLKRKSFFIAIGGGITMDVVGFAASMFRRRTPYIKIPTTLVGMIDAGVGVKVGINFEHSKNFLGAYYPPQAVFCDQTFLKTLSDTEIRSGLYEIIKMGIIKNEDLFSRVENHYQDFFSKSLNDTTDQINQIATYDMMAELECNLYETHLKRMVDFGHTFSQSIEMDLDNKIPHGEAVGVDMLLSAAIALNQGKLAQADYDRIVALSTKIGFSQHYKLPSIQTIYSSLEDIINHRNGKLNLVLPAKIGKSYFVEKLSFKDLKKALSELQKLNLFSI